MIPTLINMGYYRFENAVNLGLDSSLNSINGINHGGVQTLGVFGAGCSFGNVQGVNSYYIDLGDNFDMGYNDLTMSVWVNPHSYRLDMGLMGICGKGISGGYSGRYSLFTYGGDLACILGTLPWITVSVASNFPLNTWTHLCVVYDRDANMTLYVNGVSKGSQDISSYSSVNVTSNYKFFLGAYQDGSGQNPIYYFDGKMDEMIIWNKALSEIDVRRVMLAMHPIN